MGPAFIHGLLIRDDGLVEPLDWDGVFHRPPDDGLLWVHLDANQPDGCLPWLQEGAGLPEVVPSALLAEETRPRATSIGTGMLLVLRGVNLNPGADPEDMVSIRIWMEGRRIISSVRRRLLSVQDLVESLSERPLTGPGDFLVRLVDRITDRIGDVVEQLDGRVVELEHAVLRSPDRAMRADLADLRHDVIELRRYLAPQREALGRVLGEPLPWFGDLDRLRLRESNDRLTRIIEDLDAVRERAAVIQEELVSQLSDQLNQRMYVLSVVAAIFLPLGFLTGLLGVNLAGIPGDESEWSFAMFSLALAVLIVVQVWIFFRKKWF